MALFPILPLDELFVLIYNIIITTIGTQKVKEWKMEIELIKANDFSEGSARKRVERLRVAAYCRVSTDDEDQIGRAHV